MSPAGEVTLAGNLALPFSPLLNGGGREGLSSTSDIFGSAGKHGVEAEFKRDCFPS